MAVWRLPPDLPSGAVTVRDGSSDSGLDIGATRLAGVVLLAVALEPVLQLVHLLRRELEVPLQPASARHATLNITVPS